MCLRRLTSVSENIAEANGVVIAQGSRGMDLGNKGNVGIVDFFQKESRVQRGQDD